jgi:hypothetical protein
LRGDRYTAAVISVRKDGYYCPTPAKVKSAQGQA